MERPQEEETEEGEIVDDSGGGGDGDDPAPALHQSHPLEHSWTFWFDSPAGENKQAAWGSTIRPIYTFSAVEKF